MPAPEDPELKQVAGEQNLIGPNTAGLTLGYGIFIVQGQLDVRLLSHECRHVYQVEVAGGLESFLAQVSSADCGSYSQPRPFELDAKQHELAALPEP